jgi:hypothetical protein
MISKYDIENGICGLDRDCWERIIYSLDFFRPVQIVYIFIRDFKVISDVRNFSRNIQIQKT